MTIEEAKEKGILIEHIEPICPKCGSLMRHSFRISTFVCDNCGYNYSEKYLLTVDLADDKETSEIVFQKPVQ